jgi:hypothetical protein
MNQKIINAIKECVSQELLVSEFYRLFAQLFVEDSEFWLEMMQEEIKHAHLLHTELESLCRAGILTERAIPSNLDALLIEGASITDLFLDLQESPPTRARAFSIALALENSMSERHYRSTIYADSAAPALRLLESIDQDEKDHIKKIEGYAACHAISIKETISLHSTGSILEQMLSGL